ncbi:hypothetical protein [Nocardioides sp.]|uniref:hypothetical protein n=1 Tax=Nocardioides sp. TaxID=35761 RepID=UPI003782DDB8
MKRLIIGLIASVMMCAGLVGVSTGSASASCPYTGCVETNTKVTVPNAPVKKGKKAKVCVRVTTPGSGQPKGRVTATVDGPGLHWSRTKQYKGGQVCFTTRKINKKGTYSARGIFSPYSSTPFGGSRGETSFQVV